MKFGKVDAVILECSALKSSIEGVVGAGVGWCMCTGWTWVMEGPDIGRRGMVRLTYEPVEGGGGCLVIGVLGDRVVLMWSGEGRG